MLLPIDSLSGVMRLAQENGPNSVSYPSRHLAGSCQREELSKVSPDPQIPVPRSRGQVQCLVRRWLTDGEAFC